MINDEMARVGRKDAQGRGDSGGLFIEYAAPQSNAQQTENNLLKYEGGYVFLQRHFAGRSEDGVGRGSGRKLDKTMGLKTVRNSPHGRLWKLSI
jgi:hypothetical protein